MTAHITAGSKTRTMSQAEMAAFVASKVPDQGGGEGGGTATSTGGYQPLEIISPQPNLTTTNRFYKAYPGLLYEVAIGVVGGYYPYTFELTSAPSGMSVNSSTGVLTWTAVDEGSPSAVTARVTDDNGDQVTVSWTVTVTTDGFKFVDATAPSTGGTGTLADPYQNIVDVFGAASSKSTTYNDNEFIYFRTGVYDFSGVATEDEATIDVRVPWYVDRKPKVWLAYPGESPEINFNRNGADIYLSLQFTDDDLYFDKLLFNNNGAQRGKTLEGSPSNNWVIKDCQFSGLTASQGGGNNSYIFFNGGSGQYAHVVGNETLSGTTGYLLLGYNTQSVLVENNITGDDIPLPIGPKDDIVNWTIRGNTITNSSAGTGAVWLQEYGHSENVEICFNYIQMAATDGMAVSILGDAACGAVQVHRNTIVGHVEAWNLDSNKGPWTFAKNIIINNSAEADKITRSNVTDESRLIVNDNLLGVAADGIVDANGELTAGYSSYLGTHGHQVSGA